MVITSYRFENVRKFIDAKDAVSNNSPLLLATLVGAVECVEILFNYGASGSKDAQGNTLLHNACFSGSAQCGAAHTVLSN